jgi:ABC-type transporter Mla subunit MlaD
MYKGELPIAKSLGSLKVSAPVPAVPALAPDHSAQLGKLIEQVTALTGQVSELLAENRQLRKQLEARPASEAQAPLQ